MRGRADRVQSAVRDVGFHGDQYVLDLVDYLVEDSAGPGVLAFIETGANLGNTACYVAKRFNSLQVFSCEPAPAAYRIADQRAAKLSNLTIRSLASPAFLDRIYKEHPMLARQTNLFYLDAHGYGFDWPLRDELRWITTHHDRALILIDDFQVPHGPHFGFDSYKNQVCGMDHCRSALDRRHDYSITYPTYSARTSTFHELRGTGLISFGLQLALGADLSRSFATASMA